MFLSVKIEPKIVSITKWFSLLFQTFGVNHEYAIDGKLYVPHEFINSTHSNSDEVILWFFGFGYGFMNKKLRKTNVEHRIWLTSVFLGSVVSSLFFPYWADAGYRLIDQHVKMPQIHIFIQVYELEYWM